MEDAAAKGALKAPTVAKGDVNAANAAWKAALLEMAEQEMAAEMRKKAAGSLSQSEWESLLEQLKLVRANLAVASEKPAEAGL